jgi:putative endonuclease
LALDIGYWTFDIYSIIIPSMFGFNLRKVGYKAEEQAAKYLEKLGYKVLAKNFTIRGGEIDLVAQDGEDLVFVEVKMRSSTAFGSALESISPWKLQALQKTALFYIRKVEWGDGPYRFDLVTLDKKMDGTFEIGLMKNIISD